MEVKVTFDEIKVKEVNDIGTVKILMLKGEKGDTGYPSDEQAETIINEWLDNHPEATTTVQDGSITVPKLANDVLNKIKNRANAIKGSASGESIILNDGSDSSIIDYQLNGQTEQGDNPTPSSPQAIHSVSGDNEIRVTGFNIWDEVTANGYYGTNGAFTPNASYIASKNKIPLLPSTQYCITSLSGNLGRLCFYNADGSFNSTIVNYVGATVTKYVFTTKADVYYMAFDMRSGYGTTYKNDICINVSDTEKNGTYEPYKAQVYPINLPTENLFDVSALVNLGTNVEQIENGYRFTVTSSQYGVGIPVNFGDGSLYITCKARNITGTNLRVRVANTDNSAYDSEGTGTQTGTVKITFVTNSTKTPSAIRLNWSTAGIFELTEFMVSKLPVYTYTPYGVAPIELNALGNYKDYFHKTDGKWYLHKAIQKYVLDGTNTKFSGTWGATTNGYAVYYTLPSGDSRNANDKCDKFAADTNGYRNMPLYTFVGNSGANETVTFILPSTVTNLATANTWLTQNNLEWLHCLQTATETEITDETLISQLNALENALTYEGQTNILQNNADLPFIIDLTYVIDTKTYIDNKIAELRALIEG